MSVNYPDTQHHHSHQRLVRSVGTNPRPASSNHHFDAIIVPSARNAEHLVHAIDLASRTGSWLIVLCSRSSKAEEICALSAAKKLDRTLAIDIPDGYTHELIEFSTSLDIAVKRVNRGHSSDLSLKRNIGLILARMFRWSKIFFMDDDIRGLRASRLNEAAPLLDKYSCLAFSMSYFPDNSVVCHASRLSMGKQQGVFISGAAMGLSLHSGLSFFPDIYNEDLFFAYDHIGHGTSFHAGSLNQLPYPPFEDPGRAASQEFGDFLIEGLLALLHADSGFSYATHNYWEHFIHVRRAFINSARNALQHGDGTGNYYPALASLQAAEDRLSEITSNLCVTYLKKWRSDMQVWQQRLQELAHQSNMTTAVKSLGLTPIFADSATPAALPNSIEVREIRKDDWTLLRQVRLQALQDSPRAFISSYEKEAAFTDVQWRDLIRNDSRWFVAFDRTIPVGLAAATTEPGGPPDACHIESMWVAPAKRQTGVATELIMHLVNAMCSIGRNTILLWVLDGNDIARDAYLRLGFISTGEKQRLRLNPTRFEERMRLLIPGSA